MSNMSYCRFQNTSSDLQDCLDAVEEMNSNGGKNNHDEDLSSYELASLRDMVEQSRYFSEIATELLETLEDNE